MKLKIIMLLLTSTVLFLPMVACGWPSITKEEAVSQIREYIVREMGNWPDGVYSNLQFGEYQHFEDGRWHIRVGLTYPLADYLMPGHFKHLETLREMSDLQDKSPLDTEKIKIYFENPNTFRAESYGQTRTVWVPEKDRVPWPYDGFATYYRELMEKMGQPRYKLNTMPVGFKLSQISNFLHCEFIVNDSTLIVSESEDCQLMDALRLTK